MRNKNNAQHIFIYVTYPTLAQAHKAAADLLKKKLIACANVFPIYSGYRWKEKMVKGTEVVSVYKTRGSLAGKAERQIASTHPYETPCIATLPVSLNPSYGKWIDSETSV